jgi:DNA-binding FrmR family transcriptional regulator
MGTVDTKAKTIRLREWQEIVGVLRRIEEDESCLEVYVECSNTYRLVFPKGSAEALKRLRGLEGRTIGILKTGMPEKPIAVRLA